VLRSWRDRLLISLAPDAVSWLRVTGVFKPRVIARNSVPTVREAGQESWAGAVEVLKQEAEQWRRERLAASIVLSNQFVRYIVIPPIGKTGSRDEALALARFHFSKIHGERAAAWHVRLATPLPGFATPASAIDAALLEALKACFPREGKARLASVQPYTMAVFNFWRDRIEKDGAWLLLVEVGTACLALLAGREWVSIQNIRSGYASPDSWPALLEREKHRAATQQVPKTVLTRSAVPSSSALIARRDWQFVMLDPPALPGLAADEAEPYAMALHAA
jgi:hypothetical protein